MPYVALKRLRVGGGREVQPGEHIPEATLTCRKAGKEQQEFLIVKFTDLLISGYHVQSGPGEELPVESVSLETVVRQNLAAAWMKAEYSQTFGQHVHATIGYALIRGDATDFIGQYRLNSHALLTLRYSF